MKRICVYSPAASFFVGGGETFSLTQAKHLSLDSNYSVDFVVLKTKDEILNYKELLKGSKVKIKYIESEMFSNGINLDLTNFDNVYKFYFSLSRGFSELISREKYDLIITHLSCANFQIPSSTKVIQFLHGVPSKRDVVNEIGVTLPNKLFAVSNSVRAGWKSLYGDNLNISVLHNAVEPENFFPLPQAEDIDVFFIGRIIEIKGVQHLIKAVSILRKNSPKIIRNVVIAGIGPYEQELQKLCKELNLEGVVKFVGRIPELKKNEYYNRSKVCVFPSYAREGVLTTMLEAASAGKVVITSKCCGMMDFVVDGQNALYCEPENPEDLSKKIQMVLESDNLRREIGERARDCILDKWGWNINITALKEEIEK